MHEHESRSAPLDAILKHAALGYGAIAVGATDLRVAGHLVSPVIDDLLGASPIPVVMVRRGAREDAAIVPQYRRILVPATGTEPGRAALEMAFGVARRTDAEVLIAHVVTSPEQGRRSRFSFWNAGVESAVDSSRAAVAEQVVEEACALAARMGVRTTSVIRMGTSVAREIRDLVRDHDVDLLVVAANLRQLSSRPFLGHGVEDLLAEVKATVVVVTAPPGWVR